MKTQQFAQDVLQTSREYLAGTTAQPQVARQFEVASEQTDDLEETGLYLFDQQQQKNNNNA